MERKNEYENGIELSVTTFDYYKNGQLEHRTTYIDGERDGLREMFHENGQLWFRENWIDGEQDGLQEGFYENGQLEFRENYRDGELDGLQEDFDEEGNLTRTMTPANDREPIEL